MAYATMDGLGALGKARSAQPKKAAAASRTNVLANAAVQQEFRKDYTTKPARQAAKQDYAKYLTDLQQYLKLTKAGGNAGPVPTTTAKPANLAASKRETNLVAKIVAAKTYTPAGSPVTSTSPATTTNTAGQVVNTGNSAGGSGGGGGSEGGQVYLPPGADYISDPTEGASGEDWNRAPTPDEIAGKRIADTVAEGSTTTAAKAGLGAGTLVLIALGAFLLLKKKGRKGGRK